VDSTSSSHPPHHGGRAARQRAKLLALGAAEEFNEELTVQSAREQWRPSRRHALLHTADSVAGAAATRAKGGSASRAVQRDGVGSNATAWLEAQRLRAIVPEHRVPSLLHLYHHQLHFVYQFKAKLIAMRLSRATLRALADRYDEPGPGGLSSEGTNSKRSAKSAPPFLLRILLLSVGVLLRWRTLSWRGMCHYLRGEVLCTALSPFVLHDQASLRSYESEQTSLDGPLPPALAPERLARNVLERDDMRARVEEFQRHYLRATRGVIVDSTNAAGESNNGLLTAGKTADSSFLAQHDLSPPRDLMVHLMSMEVFHMTSKQYTEVRTLFSEPTLTRANVAALLDRDAASQALLLFDWVLLTLRAYNLWSVCPRAFVESSAQQRDRDVEGYKRYISALAQDSTQIQKHMQKQQEERTRIQQELQLRLQQQHPRQYLRLQQQQLVSSDGQVQSGTNLVSGAQIDGAGVSPSFPLAPSRSRRHLSKKPPVPRQQHRSSSPSPRASPGAGAITTAHATEGERDDADSNAADEGEHGADAAADENGHDDEEQQQEYDTHAAYSWPYNDSSQSLAPLVLSSSSSYAHSSRPLSSSSSARQAQVDALLLLSGWSSSSLHQTEDDEAPSRPMG
jgi:hypothetical protein